jgi:hypothetical protein
MKDPAVATLQFPRELVERNEVVEDLLQPAFFLLRPKHAEPQWSPGSPAPYRDGGGEGDWRGGRFPFSRQFFNASSRAALEAAV